MSSKSRDSIRYLKKIMTFSDKEKNIIISLHPMYYNCAHQRAIMRDAKYYFLYVIDDCETKLVSSYLVFSFN